MRQIVLGDILDIAQYEKQRTELRRRIIELKKRRRIGVGPSVTFVFENRATVLYQIQEMMRAERIVDDAAINHEIETYNQLLPGADQLSATMLIELLDAARIREEITRFHGVNTGSATRIEVGGRRIPGQFDAAQSDDNRISAVQYVKFDFTPEARAAFIGGAERAELVIEHHYYSHRAEITGDVREELAKDLSN